MMLYPDLEDGGSGVLLKKVYDLYVITDGCTMVDVECTG